MSSYTSEYPSVEIDSGIKKFFEYFYKVSDDPNGHEEYAQHFTENGVFIVASKKAVGHSEIISMRHAMWEKVATRKHNPEKVFPFGLNPDDVMLFGDVEYGRKDGVEATVEWAARAHFVKEQGKLKMDYYQVYMDTAAQGRPK